MAVCASCGAENREGARFCDTCGAALEAPPSTAREERKVVSVLFCDLVGFTSRAEQLDPEDVRALLSSFHQRIRSELERFGGTVEKFIGDAVMAVFGAPVVHEDDPERAVRAALAIRDWSREEPGLEVRIGITTGEALVVLGARPDRGEAMAAGDVVNTAARIQAAAPIGGVLVDGATYRATADRIEYREADAVQAKGKTERVPVWEAVQARARFGVDVFQAGVALVGRQRELDRLLGALRSAREERTCQLVTLVGVPGIGKSRLVWEVFQAVERAPDLIYWRQGRCLPYGEGVAYWAVSEMVKAQAGILDTDSAENASAKLVHAAGSAVGDEADWVAGHLRRLVGLTDEAGTVDGTRVETFAAWRRFFEGLAEERPLVLVFEDLHWADEGLLDFVDHLVDWATGVPLMVICTARPELLERRPAWGGGKLNATTLALSPLSDADSGRLIASLIGRSVLSADTQAELLARTGGNPLYAEQYARLFVERGSADDLELPETVQGIIAARLDALSPEEKAAIQDAAVIGKVFWPGGVEAIARRDSVQLLLHSLERKEFVRRERRSSVGGEVEYAFRHALVRDVAYGQIPRPARAAKHERAAEWIESLSERTDDAAEMVAHHLATALELARASGRDTTELAGRARVALRRAGERAYALGAFASANRLLRAALDLWPADDPEQAYVQLALGHAQHWTETGSDDVLVEARDSLLRQGDRVRAAEAEMLLAFRWFQRAQTDRIREHTDRAAALIANEPPSRAKVWVTCQLAMRALTNGEDELAVSLAGDAAATAERLDLAELRVHALNSAGIARFNLGDDAGLADVERSLRLAEELNAAEQLIRGYKNLADGLQRRGELTRARQLHEAGLAAAHRFGDRFQMHWFQAELAFDYFLAGRWDEALSFAEEFLSDLGGSPHYMEPGARSVVALVSLARGDVEAASRETELVLEQGRSIGDTQVLAPVVAVATRVAAELGRTGEAAALLDEFDRHSPDSWPLLGVGIPDLAFAAALLGREPRQARSRTLSTPWHEGADAVACGDFLRAAETYARMGAVPYEADARLLAARAAAASGNRVEADEQLRRALGFWRSVGASRYVRRGEALLAAAS